MRPLLSLLLISLTYFLPAQLPPGFSDEAIPGGWTLPTGIAFDAAGQGYVWDAHGRVFVLDTAGTVYGEPLIDIRDEVGRWLDHGMLGFALDPDFLENGFFYLLYTVDRHHLLYAGTPDYDPDATITHQATIGRITRYTADAAQGFRTIVPGSRKVLLGQTPADGFPIVFDTHGVGALAFGTDGSLLAACGESASSISTDNGYNDHTDYAQALAEGLLRPGENVGAFRSQLVDNLNGKILRLDPRTGDGLPGNPYFDPAAARSARSRVYALGLRNPFRFMVVPGTGSHLIEDGRPGTLIVSDVGDKTWEEINLVTGPGQNFGWPLYEGFEPHPVYHDLRTYNPDRPAEIDCDRDFYAFQDLLLNVNDTLTSGPCIPDSSAGVFCHRPPALAYQNQKTGSMPFVWVQMTDTEGRVEAVSIDDPASPLTGNHFQGDAGIAGVFYDGNNFPEEYRGRYFHADFKDWIRMFEVDETGRFTAVEDFHTDTREVGGLAVSPHDGCLYYASLKDKKLHRICFGGPAPPVARAEADVRYGPSPLTVQLSAAASYSQDSPLTYEWDFGDGQTSSEASPSHTFSATGPASFEATLTVRDTFGNERSADLTISVNNTPPNVTILSPADGGRYPIDVTSLLRLAAEATDAESPTEELSYDWQVYLHHNTHFHPDGSGDTPLSYALLSPLGCDGDDYWYRVALTVSDPHGLSATTEHRLFPDCEGDWNLGELTACPSETAVRLNWEVTGAPTLSHLEVQRSTDFYHFAKIGELAPSSGNYSFLDNQPLNGVNLYRIKAVAADGSFRHSRLATVSFPGPPALRVFPNPAKGAFTVELREAESETVRFSLFSSDGRKVQAQRWPATPGAPTRQTVDVRLLSGGLYYYLLRDGLQESVGRIVIEGRQN